MRCSLDRVKTGRWELACVRWCFRFCKSADGDVCAVGQTGGTSEVSASFCTRIEPIYHEDCVTRRVHCWLAWQTKLNRTGDVMIRGRCERSLTYASHRHY